jgi:hypothetical protein
VAGPQARAAVSPVEVQATEAVITVGWGVIGGIRGHYGCPWSLLHCTHLHAYRANEAMPDRSAMCYNRRFTLFVSTLPVMLYVKLFGVIVWN